MSNEANNARPSYAEEILAAAGNGTNLFGDPAELLQQVLDTIPQRVFWKDRSMVYLGCNQLFANDAGLQSPQDIVGLTDFDLPWDQSEAEFYRACDRRIMQTNQAEVGIVEPQMNSGGERIWLETNKVPLHDAKGTVIGILGTYHDITKQKHAERTLKETNEELEKRVSERTSELQYVAQHDSLTGLFNRSCFVDQLNAALATSTKSFALLFVDLDRFKPINDNEGHEAGDHVLIRVGEILRDEASQGDVVGRFGGDEFVAMFRSVQDEQQANAICQRIQHRLGTEIFFKGRQLPIHASIGVSFNSAAEYASADAMLRDADVAMYVAKASDQNRHYVCDDAMLERVKRNRAIEHEISSGLANQEFTVRYQPIIDLNTLALSGFEALVRWEHPKRGLVLPNEFICVAERVGLIGELGERILEIACGQLKKWRDVFPGRTDSLSVNVNVSALQVDKPDFVSMVQSIVSQAGLEPNAVRFEITESILLRDSGDAIQVLEYLRDEGFRIVLDDFGTGYSSLSYLDRLPIDTVKIDRSFVQKSGPGDGSEAIVRMILALARTLDMSVVAEGVETEAQARRLKRMKCDHVQGYLFGRPMTAEAATLHLAALEHDRSLVEEIPMGKQWSWQI